jgi:multiple sugar transport system permease protein
VSTTVEKRPATGGATGKPAKKVRTDRAKGENRLGWKLAGPALAVMLAVTAWPILQASWLSLFSYRLTNPDDREFVGLANYATVLTDGLWWRDFGVTMLLTVVTVAVELVIGFAFALVMHRIVFGRGVIRTAILVPYGIITVVSAYAWQYAFASDSGFVGSWIGSDQNFFGGFWSSFLVICLSEIWKTTPFISLLLLAGLAQVSEDMQEAAKVDGATAWQRLWKVTLPNMKGAILVAVLFRVLDAFRIFDNVFVMTGGANGTETLSLLTYRQIIGRVELGLGSAISVLLFLSVLLLAFLFIKTLKVDLASARGER